MPRTHRLFDLLQALRRRRHPVAGATLAGELGVSLRTVYRDIAALQSLGAEITGEAGIGYVLRPGFLLPPLMLSAEELEALLLGAHWASKRGDVHLARAARDAIAKIAAVLPNGLLDELDEPTFVLGSGERPSDPEAEMGAVRAAIRGGRKLEIEYQDLRERRTSRVIWPFALGVFEQSLVVAAWCELREGFRHFRTDRFLGVKLLPERCPRRRRELLRQWHDAEGIEPQRLLTESVTPARYQLRNKSTPQRRCAMFDPNFVLLYVDNPGRSAEFYAGILGSKPLEESPVFAMFALRPGMNLGLWARHTVEPAASAAGGGGEIAFTVENDEEVLACHKAWKDRGIPILQEPTALVFGFTFVALDPDGHRLRVFACAGKQNRD